jgi:hypothetical protein
VLESCLDALDKDKYFALTGNRAMIPRTYSPYFFKYFYITSSYHGGGSRTHDLGLCRGTGCNGGP